MLDSFNIVDWQDICSMTMVLDKWQYHHGTVGQGSVRRL